MQTSRRLFLSVIISTSLLSACGGGGGGGGGDKTASGAKHPLVGAPAPDFTVDAVANGSGKVSLSGLKKKVVLVDFWATWCGPCKESFPKLEALNLKYKASGLEIVGLSQDEEKGGIKDFASSFGAKFVLGWDSNADNRKKLSETWKIPNMPTSFIVDRNGIVRFVHAGFHDGEEAELEKEIKSLL